MLVYAENLYPL